MKIQVEPGIVVQLDGQRSTSAKGGVYDVSKVDDASRKRLLATKGVSEVKAPPKQTTTEERNEG